MTRKLLLVTWHDAVSNHVGWAKIEDVEKQQPYVVYTIGWEIKRTRKRLTLASSLAGDECSGDTTIPIGMIVREEVLTPETKMINRYPQGS